MKKTIIIAEAGVNHNGNINLAKKLINVASKAGADYVKFQSFKADKLVSPSAKKASYQIKNTKKQNDNFQYLMLALTVLLTYILRTSTVPTKLSLCIARQCILQAQNL